MRTRLSLSRRLGLILIPIAASLISAGVVHGQGTKFDVDYTGSLLGYYRMEVTETTPVLPPVKAFWDYRNQDALQGRHLLVGMGDNFGPELGASLQLENLNDPECADPEKPLPGGQTRPESLYKDDDRVPLLPQCDNVLNFMMQAGFRALVPGREDFMYTARWLRTSAVRLATASHAQGGSPLIKNDDRQLYLLAANLRVQLHSNYRLAHLGTTDPTYSLNGRCPLLFSDDPFRPDSAPCTSGGAEAETIDWLQRLDRLTASNGMNLTAEAMRQLATDAAAEATGRDSVVKLLVSDSLAIMQSAWGGRWPEAAMLSGKSKSGEPKGGTGKATSGKPGGAPSDAGGVLDSEQVAELLSHLQNWPECQAGAKFANDAEQADAGDLCIYRADLEQVVEKLNDLLIASKTGKSIQPCPAPDASPSIGACFVLTQEARQAAINGLLRSIAKEQKDVGYTVATEAGGKRILVIGVVGQNTMKEVSQTNLRLCIGDQDPGTQKLHPTSRFDNVHWPADFGICDVRSSHERSQHHLSAVVTVMDPVEAASSVVRAAELTEGKLDGIVLMAQMPHTEAEVLAARVWENLTAAGVKRPVNLVLSEAGETETGSDAGATETGYDTPDVKLTYILQRKGGGAMNTGHPAPVLTPFNGYVTPEGRFPGTISRASVQYTPGVQVEVDNSSNGIYPQAPPSEPVSAEAAPSSAAPTPATTGQQQGTATPSQPASAEAAPNSAGAASAATGQQQGPVTTISLLCEQLNGLCGKTPDLSDLNGRQKIELMLLAALQSATSSRPDVVLVQSRDLQLGDIGQGYRNYDMCYGDPNERLCRLRVALDRVFWKGDYIEYVAVTGKDLKAILSKSEDKIQEQNELTETDISKEWVVSYGIVQSSLANPTLVNQNNEPLWIPVDPKCKGDTPTQSTYCIGGTAVTDDGYYWLLTTDQLAEDRAVYGTFDSLPVMTHVSTQTFITRPLSLYLLSNLGNPRLSAASVIQAPGSVERAVTAQNEKFQQMPLWQVDFAKLVASFTSRQPVGGNQFVASSFQGVSDSRASAPTQQDLDVEFGGRVTGNLVGPNSGKKFLEPISVGSQTAFAYNRSVVGNLLSKPINAAYSLNNLTEGLFLQVRLGGKGNNGSVRSVRAVPRSLLVFTPHQYQLEIDHPYLFFTYAASSVPSGELTVQLPRTSEWTDRAGYRFEFGQNPQKSVIWKGSFFETGMEFSVQNNNLSSITLKTGSNQKTCHVSATLTLQNCFTASPALVINSTTTLIGYPAVKSLHTPGVYWNIHIQNRIFGKQKMVSLVTDTQGDYYFGRPVSAELPTQTEYAIPLSLSLVVPSFGNLSFAPTYSAFFYESQLSKQSLQVNSFSIAARWYFARDARVPIHRQAPLPGPQSENQTTTGTAH